MEDKKITVIFPGSDYNISCPLLYYADFSFDMKGYDRIEVNYFDILKEDSKSYSQSIEKLKKSVLIQLQLYDFRKYSDIVFVSKSLGTMLAGWVEDALDITVRHIFLTPVKETLDYIKNSNCIVIAGTNDRFLDADLLRKHCEKYGVFLKQFEGVGHSLEYTDDIGKSIDVLKEVVTFYK